jgi:hypothetical protein
VPISNLGQDSDYPDLVFSWFSSVPPENVGLIQYNADYPVLRNQGICLVNKHHCWDFSNEVLENVNL